ncbi:hypothetical protein [Actinomadura mexicana]|uniref:Peptidase inhibitor family I36 n=1 Tax=Actinomadura mexicana TaxID=134959 RepID=A0A239HIQ3_9ACTN|nr:hypothetical protein [Actinomadura mexicana]SNS81035.1 hypothetical protein SAMN06265355_13143 [Actinomadura mexicana]
MIPLAPSQAAVHSQAHSAGAAAGTECVTQSFATACFQKHGDKFSLYNGSFRDGDVASLNWSNYLRTRSGSWKYYRKGRFANPFIQNWRGDNRDLYEDQSVNAYGGKGSGIRLYACASGKGCSRYIWIRNSE